MSVLRVVKYLGIDVRTQVAVVDQYRPLSRGDV